MDTNKQQNLTLRNSIPIYSSMHLGLLDYGIGPNKPLWLPKGTPITIEILTFQCKYVPVFYGGETYIAFKEHVEYGVGGV